MNFFGLAPATLLLGALALSALLIALHFLRVRLRRVEVDTLLFFQLAGSVRQPRMLFAKPARWMALLLSVLIAFALWAALGDPRSGLDRPSRIVIVEPATGALQQQRLDAAQRWVREQGLGPRGAVLAASSPVTRWLAADEPVAWMTLRGEITAPTHAAEARMAALRQAEAALQSGDELVWIGDPPPDVPLRVPLRFVPLEDGRPLQWHAVRYRWQPAPDDGAPSCVIEIDGLARRAMQIELSGSADELLDQATVESGSFHLALQLGTAAPNQGCALRAKADGETLGTWNLPAPLASAANTPIQVSIADDVSPALHQALRALITLDPRFRWVSDAAQANLLVSNTDDSSDPRPRLIISAGSEAAARLAETTQDAPLALSLRDRDRHSAPALEGQRGTTWIEDVRSGAQLARADFAATTARIELIDWLLEPATHSDVPILLSTALDLLAPTKPPLLVPSGRAFSVPAATNQVMHQGAVSALPSAGYARFVSVDPKRLELQVPGGTQPLVVLADLQSTPALADADATIDATTLSGSGSWMRVLLLFALALLVISSMGFHRGRMP